MKKGFVRAEMKPDQLQSVKQMLSKPDQAKLLYPMIIAMADVIDSAVRGSNSYMTIGVTKDKTAIIVTIQYEGTKLYASGATLWACCDKLAESIED